MPIAPIHRPPGSPHRQSPWPSLRVRIGQSRRYFHCHRIDPEILAFATQADSGFFRGVSGWLLEYGSEVAGNAEPGRCRILATYCDDDARAGSAASAVVRQLGMSRRR